MKELKPSTQYRRDLKRIRNNPRKAEALLTVLKMLENEEPFNSSAALRAGARGQRKNIAGAA